MTTTITRAIFLLALAAATAACGAGGPASGDDSGGDDSGGGDDGIDPPDPEGWQTLLKGTWNLAANEEAYFCVIVTVPRDVYVKAFRPLTPLGTHHTVLTRYQGLGADGTTRCSFATNGTTMVYGSGVGAPDFVFPQGVGLYLAAGTRLLLNLHLYNGSDAPLGGTSGTLFQEATATEIQHRAEIVLAGPLSLSVPPGASTQSGTCNVNSITTVPIQVFSLSQHMHRLGRRMRSVAVRGSTEILLQDIPYDFEKQEFHLLPSPIELRPGDVVRTTCTFENPSTTTVHFGESSDDEMCFTDLFYYPAQNARYMCGSF